MFDLVLKSKLTLRAPGIYIYIYIYYVSIISLGFVPITGFLYRGYEEDSMLSARVLINADPSRSHSTKLVIRPPRTSSKPFSNFSNLYSSLTEHRSFAYCFITVSRRSTRSTLGLGSTNALRRFTCSRVSSPLSPFARHPTLLTKLIFHSLRMFYVINPLDPIEYSSMYMVPGEPRCAPLDPMKPVVVFIPGLSLATASFRNQVSGHYCGLLTYREH